MSTAARQAAAPFQFFTLAHVTQMSGLAANSLAELAEALEVCSDDSVYHHTVRALARRSPQNGSNDFAVWAGLSLNRLDLAEHLASLDSRDCCTVTELRNGLGVVIGDYLAAHPEAADLAGSSAFCFCEGAAQPTPLGTSARTLEEFRNGVAQTSGESLYLHLVAARSRLEKGNDFSAWLAGSLGLEILAGKIADIDLMDCPLEGARERILKLLDNEANGAGQPAELGLHPSVGVTIERAAGDRHEMDTRWNQPGR